MYHDSATQVLILAEFVSILLEWKKFKKGMNQNPYSLSTDIFIKKNVISSAFE